MKINLKNLIAFLLVYLLSTMSSYATKLPVDVLQTLKNELPNSNVRFDGLITLPDGTVYLPVLPSNPKKNSVGKIVSTYPSNKKLSQYPDVVLFDSNFALLKVIKNKNGRPTVTDTKNIPFVVKTGLFPQDMLVPPGLIIPDDMQIMMGDLKISLQSSVSNEIFKSSSEIQKASVDTKIIPVPYMAGKTLLITSLDSKLVNVIPSDSTVPTFTLKLDNLPMFVQPVCDDKYILVAVAGKTYVDVADISQEIFAKKIDLSFQPSEIVLNKSKDKAYISVSDDQSVFVIDLKTMALLEKIKIKGFPKNIALSDDDKRLVYIDKNNGDIYTLALDETYLNKYVYNASNISRVFMKGKNIYLLSRTDNNLQVINTEINDIIYKQPLADKPVDLTLIDNKLYILCASNELDIFNLNDFSLESRIKLPFDGFAKKIVTVPNTNILLITNVTNKKYLVYDYSKNSILQSVNTSVYINDLKLINKRLK